VLVNYVRQYGNLGLKLEILTEIADLIRAEVVTIPEKQPIIGGDIFTTQAGLHQTGIQRQSQTPGGLIYLPYDLRFVGRKETGLNRIGSLSGTDGIISLLNRNREASGSRPSPASAGW